MLENLKSLFLLKSAEININKNNYDLALNKLNTLIKSGYKPEELFQKRGNLCHKLLMYEEAYSDLTYVITHYKNNISVYYDRMNLNFEMTNYSEAIRDAEKYLEHDNENYTCKYIKLFSHIYLSDKENAKEYALKMFDNDKYKTIQFLFNETAKKIAEDELAKGLKILDTIESIDPINPLKMLKESQIYRLAGDVDKSELIIKNIESAFPKYFISHFRFTDMYEERNLLEIIFLSELEIFDKNKSFAYPLKILQGYKNYMEGHILDSKECFENAIEINPDKPEAYVLLGQTLQLMSGYDNPDYQDEAKINYKKAMELYERNNLTGKAEKMRRQIMHLNSNISISNY